MLVLGIETSCDETGVALYDTGAGLLGHALYSQVAMHAEYGGVVPELASRDHIRRLLPLTRQLLRASGRRARRHRRRSPTPRDRVWPARCWSAPAVAASLGFALGVPVIGLHHLEGHLLSPLLARPGAAISVRRAAGFRRPHAVDAGRTRVGDYELLGETVDDAAGEAFDKTAKLLGLPYPGGPALSQARR